MAGGLTAFEWNEGARIALKIFVRFRLNRLNRQMASNSLDPDQMFHIQNEIRIFIHRVKYGTTLNRIGEKLGLSQERIRQIEYKILRDLHRSSFVQQLAEFPINRITLDQAPLMRKIKTLHDMRKDEKRQEKKAEAAAKAERERQQMLAELNARVCQWEGIIVTQNGGYWAKASYRKATGEILSVEKLFDYTPHPGDERSMGGDLVVWDGTKWIYKWKRKAIEWENFATQIVGVFR